MPSSPKLEFESGQFGNFEIALTSVETTKRQDSIRLDPIEKEEMLFEVKAAALRHVSPETTQT